MADFYCYVVNGVIERYNIAKPKAHGNKAYGENVRDEELAADGYFPIVGERPPEQPAADITGPEYRIGEGVVERVYTITPWPPERIADEQTRIEVEAIKRYDGFVQSRLDNAARAFGYGDPNRPEISPILHVITYADEPAVVKFQAEGRVFRAWRSRTWLYCAGMLEAVRNGDRPAPTEAELLAELDEAVPAPTAADVLAEIAKLSA